MKKLLLLAMCVGSFTASAAVEVFAAKALYTKAGFSSNFYDLEMLGIERAAEKRAMALCVRSGATDCVILEGANITRCNFGYDLHSVGCEAEGFARGNR